MRMLNTEYLRLDATDARLYMALRDHGPQDAAGLAKRVEGQPPAVISHRLDLLVKAGLLEVDDGGSPPLFRISRSMEPDRDPLTGAWLRGFKDDPST